MNVSVEITTYDRAEVLRRVLELLARQTFPADQFEVVISDDGSTDGLVAMVEAMAKDLPYAVQILGHQHQGPGHAHNCGIRACRGEIVVMLAADILPTAELVEEHVKTHGQHTAEEVVVAGGLVQSQETPRTVLQRCFDENVDRVFQGTAQVLQHGGFLVSNISFKKAFMLREGMFHEWPPAAGEDIELGYRLTGKGMQLVHNPRALGHHHHEVTVESLAARAYMTGYHSHYFAERVPELWVRKRFGTVRLADGAALYLRTMLKNAIRRVLLNRLTIEWLVVAPIRRAEHRPRLAPLVPALTNALTSYYFRRGARDFNHGIRGSFTAW